MSKRAERKAALGAISPAIYSGNCIDGGRHINYLADLAETSRDIAGERRTLSFKRNALISCDSLPGIGT